MSGSTLITSFPQKDQKIISPISRSVVMLPKYIPLLFFLHFPTVKIKFKYYYTHFEENVCMYVCTKIRWICLQLLEFISLSSQQQLKES